jgi:GTPase SAR1 family protein
MLVEWLVKIGAVEIGKFVLEQGFKMLPDILKDVLKDVLKDSLKDVLKKLRTWKVELGIDIDQYRQSLKSNYSYLKLYPLDGDSRTDPMKLWNMFIEQTVREALPPLRDEVPLDVKRMLEAGLAADLLPATVVKYQQYLQEPPKKVLEAIADSRRAVILGDPGAGKSTLLQYLALRWADEEKGKDRELPLLIELREYTSTGVSKFLDFLYQRWGTTWTLDQPQLHSYLHEHPTLIMFDGLDEVDQVIKPTIEAEIIRFSEMYPKAQVLVTSRLIGHNPESFQQAKFKQFTIQPLDKDEIHEFIDRWYDLALGVDSDKARLVKRLKDAIGNSKAIQDLADNPLLLTMMAILNREQEPPTRRSDLYHRASRVLLDKWDSEAKQSLEDPRLKKYPIEIDYRDKQGMLRQVAYSMQMNENGLAGNSIRREDLENCLKNYLKTTKEAANAPSIAAVVIDQLRERNFILCHWGADTYGFVHRTFLEYFCAMEIVQQFKEKIITFEQLRDEVFGLHWEDETWHEVLRLICGAIDAKFTSQIIDFLFSRDILNDPWWEEYNEHIGIDDIDGCQFDLVKNLLIADCFSELEGNQVRQNLGPRILQSLQNTYIESDKISPWEWSAADEDRLNRLYMARHSICDRIAQYFRDDVDIFEWLKSNFYSRDANPDGDWGVDIHTLNTMLRHFSDHPYMLTYLLGELEYGDHYQNDSAILNALGDNFKDNPRVFEKLMSLSESGDSDALSVLGRCYTDCPDVFFLLKKYACSSASSFKLADSNIFLLKLSALKSLVLYYPSTPESFALIKNFFVDDPAAILAGSSLIEEIVRKFTDQIQVFELVKLYLNEHSLFFGAGGRRQKIIEGFVKYQSTNPRTLELLHDRALNDPDDQLRTWAQAQLQKRSANP